MRHARAVKITKAINKILVALERHVSENIPAGSAAQKEERDELFAAFTFHVGKRAWQDTITASQFVTISKIRDDYGF